MQLPARSTNFKRIVEKFVPPLLVCLGLFHILSQVNNLVSRYPYLCSSFLIEMKRLNHEVFPLAKDPDKLRQFGAAESKYTEGMMYASLNDYPKAKRAYETAVTESEAAIGRLTEGTFLFEIGRARFENDSGHYVEAARLYADLADFWKEKQVMYNYLDARDHLAETMQLLGKTDATREIAESDLEAVELLDDRPASQRPYLERIVLWRLLNCYNAMKQREACAETYSQLLELNKKTGYGNSEIIESLIGLSGQKMWFTNKLDYSEVLVPLKEALQLDPLNIDASYYGMYTCLWAHQYQEAFIWWLRWIMCCFFAMLLTSFLGITRVRPRVSD
jgi:tetratricopeptide (TPR) repeat protein